MDSLALKNFYIRVLAIPLKLVRGGGLTLINYSVKCAQLSAIYSILNTDFQASFKNK